MIRTALIGLGKVARDIHLPACQQVPAIEIVAGADSSPEQQQKTQSRFDIPHIYEDADAMLREVTPDLVIVATPPDTHYEMTCLSLRHGSHVLCEKPFMPSVEKADSVIHLATEYQRLLRVNNQYRYMAPYRVTQEHLQRGDFGRLFMAQVWQQMWHPPAEDETSWRTSLKQSTLYEFGSHPLDLLAHFFGALPTHISATIPQVYTQYDSDVLVQLTLHFPQDRLATVVLNRVSHAPERYLEMRLDCESASLRLSLGGVARLGAHITRYRGRISPHIRFSFVRGGEARMEQGGRSNVIARETRPAFASATARLLKQMIADMQRPINNESAVHARNILYIIFKAYEAAEQRATLPINYKDA